ncbi:hypothetical protein DBR42_25270 [Pelomonas sp. HMWF004]|nr:hypothetical protein DBR42_25270 [Pelomonas sp. HMWF004]
MCSLRVTNYLLLVIAVTLTLITAKAIVPSMIPEAKAAPISVSAVYLQSGCFEKGSVFIEKASTSGRCGWCLTTRKRKRPAIAGR